MNFSDFSLARELVSAVGRIGFEEPTPIQRESIPPALEGRDILAGAETGSGKTASFLLPIMHKLLPMQRGATRALVVAPTRELAAQITEHFMQLAHGTRLTCAAVHGGVAMGAQERAFRKGVDMIVACPGRLLDHLRFPYANLSGIQFLVIDEADRMLDMGFLPDIKRVLAAVPKDRQTFFFSATLPPDIIRLSNELLKNPARLNIDRKAAPPTTITHAVYPVPSDRKSSLFLELLGKGITGSVLVFTRTKHRANRLADFLDTHGVPCARIHGNRSQSQRTAALAGFKQGRFQVLVATDIAARGIDVEALGNVVNFDVPHQPEDYIHRVGRTARAQLSGDAYTLLSPEEEKDFGLIEKALGRRLPRQKMDGFDYASQPKAASAERAERAMERSSQGRFSRSGERVREPRRAQRAPREQQPQRSYGDARREQQPQRSSTEGRRGQQPQPRPYNEDPRAQQQRFHEERQRQEGGGQPAQDRGQRPAQDGRQERPRQGPQGERPRGRPRPTSSPRGRNR
jgi:ATP-dependent RNA helicase RhlE